MDVLIIEALPRWLSTLQISRLAPEKQQLARALQQQAEDALESHFSVEAAREAAPPPNPSAEPPRSPRQMTHKAFERLHQAADVLDQAADALHQTADELDEIYMVDQEEKEAMGDHIVALEAEVKLLKQGPASKVASKPRQPLPQDGPILTAEHRNQAYALARDERSRSGQRVDTLLRELAELFGVEDISDVPDAAWDDALTWFWERRQRR